MPENTIRVLNDYCFGLFSRESGTWREGSNDRIYRRTTIDDDNLNLVGYGTLDAQGNALGAWIETAFSDLRDALTTPEVHHDFEKHTAAQ